MKDRYLLMHKDIPCGVLSIDRDSGALDQFVLTEKEYAPFLGNADEQLMKIWWKHRAVPGTRKDIKEIIKNAGCETNEEYLAKNLALSLTDTYWICPADIELKWADVNLYDMDQADRDYLAYRGGSSYDPNASLGGEMDKYWDVGGETPVLIKKSYQYGGHQSVNEAFATHIHMLQDSDIPFVEYNIKKEDDGATLSLCNAFTSQSVEFVSAYEVIRSAKIKQSQSDLEHYLSICSDHGLDIELMQNCMDYMILSDFAISNVDEHLGNFGVLRDADTMELIGPAPIFDSGNSMFYNMHTGAPLSRIDLLSLKINSVHKSEEKMLQHVLNNKILDYDKLPTRDETADYYCEHGSDEARASFIADSYSNKLTLLQDYLRGITISLYHEKQNMQ